MNHLLDTALVIITVGAALIFVFKKFFFVSKKNRVVGVEIVGAKNNFGLT